MTERQKGQKELKKIYKEVYTHILKAMKISIRTGDTTWHNGLFKAYQATQTLLEKHGYLKQITKGKNKGDYMVIKGW